MNCGVNEGRCADTGLHRLISIENGGGGGSWSTKIAEFSNDLSESKRPTSTIGQKALVQVQNRYSRSVLASNHPASATGST